MKDSIGTSVIIKIFLTFIIIDIIFMAAIINYTKSYRIKNQIINILERSNGVNADSKQEIQEYIDKQGIYANCMYYDEGNNIDKYKGDRCEIQAYQPTTALEGYYYKVRVYVQFTLPLVKQSINIPITGETKVTYKIPENSEEPAYYKMIYDTPETKLDDLETVKKPGSDPPGGGGTTCKKCNFTKWTSIPLSSAKKYCNTKNVTDTSKWVCTVKTDMGTARLCRNNCGGTCNGSICEETSYKYDPKKACKHPTKQAVNVSTCRQLELQSSQKKYENTSSGICYYYCNIKYAGTNEECPNTRRYYKCATNEEKNDGSGPITVKPSAPGSASSDLEAR